MLSGLPQFLRSYMQTRPWKLLLSAVPGLMITMVLVTIVATRNSAAWRRELQSHYSQLLQTAQERDDSTMTELYFARLLTLTDDPQRSSFEYAKFLYEKSNAATNPKVRLLLSATANGADDAVAPDAFAKRSFALLQSLAPRRQDRGGYLPAHLFLADHFETRRPKSDVTEFLTLHHRMSGQPNSRTPALDLARFLSSRQYHQRAIECLKPWRNGHPDVQMALAMEYTRLGNRLAAKRELDLAEQQLTQELQEQADAVDVRQRLSRVLGAQGRVLESIFLLAEGYQRTQNTELANQLFQTYTVWLSGMSPQSVRKQLDELQLAVAPSAPVLSEADTYPEELLVLSSGESVLLPSPVTAFHKALFDGEGAWLAPLLLGTDKAQMGDLDAAIDLLETAIGIRPGHPVIANNLAWVIWKQADDAMNRHLPHAAASDGDQQVAERELKQHTERLQRAWELAESAVKACEENMSFRETRGLVAAATGRWQIAVDDLQMCVDSGRASEDLFRWRLAAKSKLSRQGNDSEASRDSVTTDR